MTLSSPLTVVGLMNGMIGGVILVLPVSSHEAGYLFTILAIIFSGAFSFYSCYLSVKHLGDQKDMNFAMFVHFGNSMLVKNLYDIVVCLGLLLGSMFYYGLICIQWQSITGIQSVAIPLINTALIFCLIFILKYFDISATLMAYGIISIFCYLIFLIWVVASAPKGNTPWEPIGTNLYTFGATMSLAFTIQAFFIPFLMKNPKKNKHIILTFSAYVIGACVYTYISFMGSFGIMNRIPIKSDPQTIQDYFKTGNLQLIIIECIYLIHLYSCLPQFVLIGKKRLFNIFKIVQTKKGKISIKQIIYCLTFLGLCLMIKLLGVKINTIIAINGAIIGFFNVYLFPITLHIKCLYFSKNKNPSKNCKANDYPTIDTQKLANIQLEQAKQTSYFQKEIQSNKDSIQLKDPLFNDYPQFSSCDKSKSITSESGGKGSQNCNEEVDQRSSQKKQQKQLAEEDDKSNVQAQLSNQFICDCQPPESLILKCLQVMIILIMVAVGAAIMVNGLISVI